ncbi:hypothetical protein S40293_10455 [Stachybotrys chartarum IBT 40293]|nr:hypothetical protein S40293_10455 [Stachybotrys chartarum IBT 40293]
MASIDTQRRTSSKRRTDTELECLGFVSAGGIKESTRAKKRKRVAMPKLHIVRDSSHDRRRPIPAHQLNCVKAIFLRILTLPPRIRARTPQLIRLRSSYMISDRGYLLRNLTREIRIRRLHRHGFHTEPSMQKKALVEVYQTFIQDISYCHSAHIAYEPDTWATQLVQAYRGRRLSKCSKPWIDAFDYDKHPNDPTINWELLKEYRIGLMHAQFEVLLIMVDPPVELDSLMPRAGRQPDMVAQLLSEGSIPLEQCHQVIQLTRQYSESLSHFVIRNVQENLLHIGCYHPAQRDEGRQNMEDDFRTTEHLLRLVESGSLPLQIVLWHRVTIAVLQTAYLIYFHAKNYNMSTVKDILTGLRHHTTEMYENEEAFLAVAYSVNRAWEAIHVLEEAGGHLDDDTKYYITED